MRQDRGSGRTERDQQFHDFVVERRRQLVRTATLLTAGDAHLAEDLVQSTLTKLYVSWKLVKRTDNPDGYVRRVMVNALTDERRRPFWRKESPVADVPDVRTVTDATDGMSHAVRQALRELPPRMRAAVVFRYFYDLDIAATADALNCSAGTVKSQTARAIDRLRAALQPAASSSGSPIVSPEKVAS